ncbi:hypothetical protein B0A75_00515 [Flavobacterium oncorhynchi]|uniref:DUF3800 domain-containing protein n=1 Tax=Flavobacterium oncorhynchi TaxID=728056 RepID=A0A226IAP6_9FLAO|nr:DUF3800 domain-containing protein [Flavobacterium oncorhynchi]OXB03458.1 hypothetical protein B0A75_00515 [Flavobacterium oncorhynchi]
MKYTIYIDDTGTPSFQSKSIYDSGDWHSQVAIFINQNKIEEITNKISEIFNKYKNLNDFEEFHFIRILSGKDGWRKVDLEKRLEIFKDFGKLYQQYKSPILIQSFTSDDIIRNKMEKISQIKIPNFDLSKLSDLTLLFLLFRLKDYVKENKLELPTQIKVDTGKGEHLDRKKIPILNGITQNSEIEFIDSKKDPLMQFADFVAFCLNRMRWIIMAENKGPLDLRLLEIFSDADFEVENLQKFSVDPNEVKAKHYDEKLRKVYDSNGNLSDAEVNKIKEKGTS